MFSITIFNILSNLKLCTCDHENIQSNTASNIFSFGDFDDDYFLNFQNPYDGSRDDDGANNLNTFPSPDSEKIDTENAASNSLNFNPDDFLWFLDAEGPNNQEDRKQNETTTCESSYLNQVAATNIIDDFSKSPQTKRKKTGEKSVENHSNNDNDFNAQSNLNSNIAPTSLLSTHVKGKESSLVAQEPFEKMLDELKKQYSTIKQKIDAIKELFHIIPDIYPFINNSRKFASFLFDFIEKQQSLIENITSKTDSHPEKNLNCVKYLDEEILKPTLKKSADDLINEYTGFIAKMKNYFSKNTENLIDIEVINSLLEVLELYIKEILSDKSDLVRDIDYAVYHYKSKYSTRKYEVFDTPNNTVRILSACMNSKYTYAIYGNRKGTSPCNIIKISNADKTEKPKIQRDYTSKDSNDSIIFDKFCKRILTDSEGRIYILQMDNRNPTILVLNEKFEEIVLIDCTKTRNDSSVVNAPIIADMCLHENKLYFLDCNNRYIYCYDLDLKYESKIEIPGDFTITKRDSFFSFSGNYIFIVDDKSFFAFLPDSKLFVEPKENFINPTDYNHYNTSFICLSENIIAFKVKKIIYLHEFRIENTGKKLNFKLVITRAIDLYTFFNDKSTIIILNSSENNKLKIIGFSGLTVKLVEYD